MAAPAPAPNRSLKAPRITAVTRSSPATGMLRHPPSTPTAPTPLLRRTEWCKTRTGGPDQTATRLRRRAPNSRPARPGPTPRLILKGVPKAWLLTGKEANSRAGQPALWTCHPARFHIRCPKTCILRSTATRRATRPISQIEAPPQGSRDRSLQCL